MAFLLVARRFLSISPTRRKLGNLLNCLLPFILSIKQVITGKSMQPFHYGISYANYGFWLPVVLIVF
jgi:hypothetical protein